MKNKFRWILPCLFLLVGILFLKPVMAEAAISGPSNMKSYHAYVAIDARDGKILMGSKYNNKVYPASTTKIMTALVVLDRVKSGRIGLNDRVKITSKMLSGLNSSLAKYGLKTGETYTLSTLLHMSLIESDADAMNACAVYAFGSTTACVKAMNSKVSSLGLTKTHFDNVIGMDLGAGYYKNYTTALEMARITQYAMKNGTFAAIVKKKTAAVKTATGTSKRSLVTTNYLMSQSQYKTSAYTVIGCKTGTTNAAGYVLSSMAVNSEGHQVISVLMSKYSKDSRFYDTKKILDRAFTNRYTLNLSIPQLSTPVLKSAACATTGVKVSWNAVTGASTYRVFRKNSSGGWTRVGDTKGTSLIDTKAVSGEDNTYTVRCVASSGKQYNSPFDRNGVTVRYLATPKLNSAAVNNKGVLVRWNAVTGADRYYVYRKTSTGWLRLAVVTGTSYQDTEMSTGQQTYTVVAGQGTYRGTHDRTGSTVTYLDTPEIVKIGLSRQNGTYLRWNAVADAETYLVYRLNESGKWIRLGTTVSTSYMDTDTEPGKSYTYTVKCISKSTGVAQSGYESPGFTIVRLTQPELNEVIGVSTGISLKWGEIAGAEHYYVYRKTADTKWKAIATVEDEEWIDTTAEDGQEYFYMIRAFAGTSYSTYDNAGIAVTWEKPEPETETETEPESETPPETTAEESTEEYTEEETAETETSAEETAPEASTEDFTEDAA